MLLSELIELVSLKSDQFTNHSFEHLICSVEVLVSRFHELSDFMLERSHKVLTEFTFHFISD